MKMPNLIGSKTQLKFDLVGSTSVFVEAKGIAMKSFTGTFTPKATLELAASNSPVLNDETMFFDDISISRTNSNGTYRHKN